jgi:hypothetical protein
MLKIPYSIGAVSAAQNLQDREVRMTGLTCVPTDITLSCREKHPDSKTTVRIYAAKGKKDVEIAALGYDPAVATLNPAKDLKTNENGYLPIEVQCADKGACPADTVVTFDSEGDTCTLTVHCSDRKPPS